ncbi:hypothetical protein [Methylobacterium sp. R2-1]|uniref:hypothetical protein n=1 Tax=Methylobacterium sp. R2-1 TaxID=2587064 RepID=UPI001614E8E0|nr:hypothetical protein [Methylobacterium sp. R2-1]MBB2964463.1 hypothetical protein [Methylobacterium sp. R2-1]
MTIVHPTLSSDGPAAYRTHTLTEDGHVLSSAPLSACSDDEALSLAATMARDAGIDLWDGLRFIAHFEPEPVPATAG